MDLQECRAKIDEIDRELVRLFADRMNIVLDVAAYKKANGLPILDAARERALLSKVASLSGEELLRRPAVSFRDLAELDPALEAVPADAAEHRDRLWSGIGISSSMGEIPPSGAAQRLELVRAAGLPGAVFFNKTNLYSEEYLAVFRQFTR